MSKDDVQITEEVHVEVTPGHDPFKTHKAAKKTAAKHVNAAVAPAPREAAPEPDGDDVIAIGEAAWTVQDIQEGYLVIDRPQDWPTQDYVAKPPAPVAFERPFDSI